MSASQIQYKLSPSIIYEAKNYSSEFLWRIKFIFVGDGCADKPLSTLWKNYATTEKPNIIMKVTVCASGKLIGIAFTF